MKKQRKAAQKAIEQAAALQGMYTQAGMTPDQVNQINSQVANIGGATKQQIAAASTGMGGGPQDGGGAPGGGYSPEIDPNTGYDAGYGQDVYNATADDGSGFLEQLELLKIDPIYSMVRYNKMVGGGSKGGINYSEKWECPEYFENYETVDLAGLGGDIDSIISQFTKNWEQNKPANWNEKENLFGINKFFKNLGRKKHDDDMAQEELESLETANIIMEYLPMLIVAYIGYHFYGYTGAIVGGLAGYFLFHKKHDPDSGGAAGAAKKAASGAARGKK